MMDFKEYGVRGGLSLSNRHGIANQKYLDDYDKKSIFIEY